jgi:hypothetical protein
VCVCVCVYARVCCVYQSLMIFSSIEVNDRLPFYIEIDYVKFCTYQCAQPIEESY